MKQQRCCGTAVLVFFAFCWGHVGTEHDAMAQSAANKQPHGGSGAPKAANKTLEECIENLEASTAEERLAAVRAIGTLHSRGRFVEPAIPALVRRIRDNDPRVRLAAAERLVAIQGGDAKEAVAYLTEIANDKRAPGANAARGLLRKVKDGTARFNKVDELMKRMENNAARESAATELAALAREDQRALPPNVVATFLAMLKEGESLEVRFMGARVLAALQSADAVPPLIELLDKGDEGTRSKAAKHLAEIGPAAKDAAPALARVLRQYGWHYGRSGQFAADALIQIGSAAAPAVAELLDQREKADVRQQSAHILFRMRGDAKEQKEALSRLLSDADDEVRITAAAALIEIDGPDAKAALKTFDMALRSPKVLRPQQYTPPMECARRIIAAMSTAGKQSTLPVLITLTKDRDPSIRNNAANTIGNFTQADLQSALPDLLQLLEELTDSSVRGQIQNAIKKIDSDVALAAAQSKPLSPWIKQLQEGGVHSRENAARAIGEMGRSGAPAVGALMKALKDEAEGVRLEAANALAKIGPEAKAAVPTLAAALHDKSWQVGVAAASALEAIGPDAKDATSALATVFMTSPYPKVSRACARAMGAIGHPDKQVISALASALNVDEPFITEEALNALGRLGQPAVPHLIGFAVKVDAATGDKYGSLAPAAVSAIIKIGPDAKDAVPGLMKLLNSSNRNVRRATAEALGAIGPDAKAALPKLEELRRRDPFAGEMAAEAIEKIKGK